MIKTIASKFFKTILTLYRWIRSFSLNLLFIIVLISLIGALFSSNQLSIPDGAALVITPSGTIVEEKVSVSTLGDLVSGGASVDETLLQDLLDGIEIAGRDESISSIVLRLDYLQGAALSKLQDIGKALNAFKETGKPVYAIAHNLSQSQYYLASYADEVILNKMGAVALEGFSSYQYYFAEIIEKLKINVHVFRVGEFKSAVEPYELNAMSDAAKANYQEWLNQSWQIYIDDVSRERNLNPELINELINTMDQQLANYGGDTAALALGMDLVDRIDSRPEIRKYLIEKIGFDSSIDSFIQVPLKGYLAQRQIPLPATLGENQIAIIVASGTIYDGEQAPGSIGGDTLSSQIREAKNDDNIKGLVLRVDSPGGSAFASEVIRSELLDFKASGKTLVVSMSSVAASGGYWIATAADKILASPATITGSIGIFGIYPTFNKSLETLGVYVDGVGTTSQAGAFGLGRELPEITQNSIQLNIEKGYERFLQIVSDSRNMTMQEVDAVAQGRVWSADDALRHGLIDEIGDLDKAIEVAADLAGLEQYRSRQIMPFLSPSQMLLESISENFDIQSWITTNSGNASLKTRLNLLYKDLSNSLSQLLDLNDPNSLYLQCFTCQNIF